MMVYVPCKDKKEAKKIASHLLKKKLIACANMFPVSSLYRWEGKTVEDRETVLIAKSIPTKWNPIKKEITKLHSYACPCIEKINVSWNKQYADWVRGEVT
jgi:periplasmic divalent cation tolerance protein